MQNTPEQTILQMFDHLDERRYEELLAMMTTDAVWHRQGQRLQGHAQILEALNKRSSTMRVRHLITNLLCRRESDEQIEFSHYMTALRHDDGAAQQGSVRISSPFNMSIVKTTLRRQGTTWAVSEQSIVTEFEFAA